MWNRSIYTPSDFPVFVRMKSEGGEKGALVHTGSSLGWAKSEGDGVNFSLELISRERASRILLSNGLYAEIRFSLALQMAIARNRIEALALSGARAVTKRYAHWLQSRIEANERRLRIFEEQEKGGKSGD